MARKIAQPTTMQSNRFDKLKAPNRAEGLDPAAAVGRNERRDRRTTTMSFHGASFIFATISNPSLFTGENGAN
jgi:hypothetical protein